ncbi:MAG: C1 family peptidase [Ferruginibacter sp.]
MGTLKLDSLVSDLHRGNARWRAIENHISILPDDAKKKLLGFDPTTAQKAAPKAGAARAALAYDPAVDWRNRNGNHVTAVKSQGRCGSCVSFCTVAVTESMASIEKNQLIDLSEGDQHFCSSHGANCGGWNHQDAFNQIKSRGVCDEACFPYATAFPGNDIWANPANPTCHTCADRNSRITKITATHDLNTYQEAKNYLTTTGPIATAFAVYTDFYNYQSGVYHHISGVLEGYHCVAIIGYSEAEQCWICKNSWDTGWGMGGFFKIAYGECDIDTWTKTGVTGVILPQRDQGWYGYENLGGLLTSKPNAVSWGDNRIDVVVRGTDSAVYHKWWNGSSWNGYESLGGQIQGAPAICSWANGRLDIFVTGMNHHLYHKWYQGGWSGWEDLGGMLSSEPTAVSWGNGRIDVFARGMNSAMFHMWYDGNWHSWEDLGGTLGSGPAAASWSANRLDCFVMGMDHHLYHKWWDGKTWSTWENLGGTVMDSPGAVSWGKNRIDVFYPGTNYHMKHKWWDGKTWSGEEDLGGLLSSGVGVSSWKSGRLDCFVEGTDSSMYHKWYQ